jgi:hypothetical protein
MRIALADIEDDEEDIGGSVHVALRAVDRADVGHVRRDAGQGYAGNSSNCCQTSEAIQSRGCAGDRSLQSRVLPQSPLVRSHVLQIHRRDADAVWSY